VPIILPSPPGMDSLIILYNLMQDRRAGTLPRLCEAAVLAKTKNEHPPFYYCYECKTMNHRTLYEFMGFEGYWPTCLCSTCVKEPLALSLRLCHYYEECYMLLRQLARARNLPWEVLKYRVWVPYLSPYVFLAEYAA
jgi:hypothetical protein